MAKREPRQAVGSLPLRGRSFPPGLRFESYASLTRLPGKKRERFCKFGQSRRDGLQFVGCGSFLTASYGPGQSGPLSRGERPFLSNSAICNPPGHKAKASARAARSTGRCYRCSAGYSPKRRHAPWPSSKTGFVEGKPNGPGLLFWINLNRSICLDRLGVLTQNPRRAKLSANPQELDRSQNSNEPPWSIQ